MKKTKHLDLADRNAIIRLIAEGQRTHGAIAILPGDRVETKYGPVGDGKPARNRNVAEAIGCTPRQARVAMRAMVRAGMLRAVPTGDAAAVAHFRNDPPFDPRPPAPRVILYALA